MSRLFLDYCSGEPAARRFYGDSDPERWQQQPELPAHRAEILDILAQQNPGDAGAASLEALRQGAGAVLTGQQVGLFGGPLFVPLKAATAVARARQATHSGRPHVAIFWLASEDHDFAEINNVE